MSSRDTWPWRLNDKAAPSGSGVHSSLPDARALSAAVAAGGDDDDDDDAEEEDDDDHDDDDGTSTTNDAPHLSETAAAAAGVDMVLKVRCVGSGCLPCAVRASHSRTAHCVRRVAPAPGTPAAAATVAASVSLRLRSHLRRHAPQHSARQR